jgi:hypothetical protein
VRESRREVDRFIEKAHSKFPLFGGEGDGRDSREEARLVDKENNYCDVFLGLREEGGGATHSMVMRKIAVEGLEAGRTDEETTEL